MRIKSFLLYLIGAMVSMFQFVLLVNFMDNFKEYLEKKRDDLRQGALGAERERFNKEMKAMSGKVSKVVERVAELEQELEMRKANALRYRIMLKILGYSYIHNASLDKSIEHFTTDPGHLDYPLLDDDTKAFLSRFNDTLQEYEVFQFQAAAVGRPWLAKDEKNAFIELRLRRKV